MIKNFFLFPKIIFYVANVILITLYLFPGSILGWLLYGNAGLQPQITSDFIVSSNHVFAFTALSTLGYLSYDSKKLTFVFSYLFLLCVFLELFHLIIPNRGFEFSDVFGNILGVLLIFTYYKIKNLYK